jgi:hypothetical protein
MMALDALCGSVPRKMVSTIIKEAWDAITTIRIDDNHVKKATVQQLCRKFDLATFDDGESIEDYALH